MGSGRSTPSDWDSYATARSYSTKSTAEIFHKTTIDKDLDPKGVKVRESRDSKDNPKSTPLIVGLDVTGSMDKILDVMARQGMKTLMTEVLARQPIHDPHLMAMGIGDAEMDSCPLQVTQFEADIRIAEQLEKVWLERGGGGNTYEGYALAWYFAARHTVTDAWEKRQKKGYLFTVGDECATPHLLKHDIERITGDVIEADKISCSDMLDEVSRKWEVFHIMVMEGDFASHNADRVKKSWTSLLGQRAIALSDHTKLAETVVSIIQLNEGEEHDKVIGSWDGTTSLVVAEATRGLVKKSAGGDLVNV